MAAVRRGDEGEETVGGGDTQLVFLGSICIYSKSKSLFRRGLKASSGELRMQKLRQSQSFPLFKPKIKTSNHFITDTL